MQPAKEKDELQETHSRSNDPSRNYQTKPAPLPLFEPIEDANSFRLSFFPPPKTREKAKMSGFASSVMLGDLNDFISPSQACVNPLFASDGTDAKNGSKAAGTAGEGDNSEALPKVGLRIDSDALESFAEPNLIRSSQTQTARVSLSDCLACSGCVTSAETVLIEQQSGAEFLKALKGSESGATSIEVFVVTVSRQSCASLQAHFGLRTENDALKIVERFLEKQQKKAIVFEASLAGDIALLETAKDFCVRWKRKDELKKPWEIPEFSVAVNSKEDRIHPNSAEEKVVPKVASEPASLPLLTSVCPGWICYAEKSSPEAIPYISTAKSPQQIAGSLVKRYVSQKSGISAEYIYHATVMPCADKKLEASRKDFLDGETETKDVDCVLSTIELAELLEDEEIEQESEQNVHMETEGFEEFNGELGLLRSSSSYGVSAMDGGSGGYLEYTFRFAAKELFGVDVPEGPLPFKKGRNADIKTVELHVGGKVMLTFATAYGFRNIQAVVRQMKRQKCKYDFIEIMACPSGCLNGGGQIRPAKPQEEANLEGLEASLTNNAMRKERLDQVSQIFHSVPIQYPHQNPNLSKLYRDWLASDLKNPALQSQLHTKYHAVPKLESGLTQTW